MAHKKQYAYLYFNPITKIIEHCETSTVPILFQNIIADNDTDLEIHAIEMDNVVVDGTLRAREIIDGMEELPNKSIVWKTGHKHKENFKITKHSPKIKKEKKS